MARFKIVVVSKSRNGGAGTAAHRWSEALMLHRVDHVFYDESTNLSQIRDYQRRMYAFTRAVNRFGLVLTRLTGHIPFGPFSFALIPTYHEAQIERLVEPEGTVLNFHWINNGFLSRKWMSRIQLELPVVWTLHDTWLLNGLTHYEVSDVFIKLRLSFFYRKFAERDKRQKSKLLFEAQGFISPTEWIANSLKNRGVKPELISVIPNIVPFDVFHPLPNRKECKEYFEFSKEKIIIGFVSGSDFCDRRKGLDIFVNAYRLLTSSDKAKIEIVIVGRSRSDYKFPVDFDFKILSPISEAKIMNLFYNAIDLLVVPSRADNLPQTSTEAQSAGCPVLVSNVGGCPETILENFSGQVFEPTPLSLMSVLKRVLSNEEWLLGARDEAYEFSRRAWDPAMLTKRYEMTLADFASKWVVRDSNPRPGD